MPCQREARPVLRVPVHKQKITRQREAVSVTALPVLPSARSSFPCSAPKAAEASYALQPLNVSR